MSFSVNDDALICTKAYIDGQWSKADSGETFDVLNPASNEVIASVSKCGTNETQKAIIAAEKAMGSWRQRTAKDRSTLLMAWHDEVVKNANDLARILTLEQGKPLGEAKGEILYGANYIRWFAEEAKRIYGDTIPGQSPDKRVVVIKQPIGVVACITPWNFPNAMLARKIAPALAAGNTVVCKPANATPLSALALGELASRAGIPAGVINILCGKTSEIGAELTSNPLVKKLSFTGSTEVGKKLTADCSATMKRTSMELGGNAPFIIFDDADVDEAVTGLIASKFRNAGQTCVCSNRIFVHNAIHDEFTTKFTQAVFDLKMGSGIEEGTDIGPLIDKNAADNVRSIIADAQTKGAKLATQGTGIQNGGNFVPPTIIYEATDDMRVFNEEIFGPVAPVFRFESETEVIEDANNTPFGLAAYFYSRDIGRIWRVSEGLDYGMVGINTGAISNEMAPFGGVKESGQGREGSKYGLDDYLEIKSLTIGGLDK